MMIRWWEHSQKGVTNGQTDRRTDRWTENTTHRAAWSQLKIQDEVSELKVTVATEPDDSYKVRSSETGRDSQRYLLAMVYHVEMCSLRTILFVIALNLRQIPKVVY